MARERGGGTRFGAVPMPPVTASVTARCSAVCCGYVFMRDRSQIATLICLVTSQVISYIKARAEASGCARRLHRTAGTVDHVLTGAGVSDFRLRPAAGVGSVGMWLLAVAMRSPVQRLHTV